MHKIEINVYKDITKQATQINRYKDITKQAIQFNIHEDITKHTEQINNIKTNINTTYVQRDVRFLGILAEAIDMQLSFLPGQPRFPALLALRHTPQLHLVRSLRLSAAPAVIRSLRLLSAFPAAASPLLLGGEHHLLQAVQSLVDA